jgi:hypothetical protein
MTDFRCFLVEAPENEQKWAVFYKTALHLFNPLLPGSIKGVSLKKTTNILAELAQSIS